jgi:hypothetical protein
VLDFGLVILSTVSSRAKLSAGYWVGGECIFVFPSADNFVDVLPQPPFLPDRRTKILPFLGTARRVRQPIGAAGAGQARV